MGEIQKINIAEYEIGIYSISYLEKIKGLYGFIYITTNLINGKKYIGQKKIKTSDKYKSNSWKEYLGSGKALLEAIDKYGKENFRREIIDIAFNFDELNHLENMYTKLFNVVDDRDWYNLCYGGGVPVGYHQTEELKEKRRLLFLGDNNPRYGKPFTKEMVEKRNNTMTQRGINLGVEILQYDMNGRFVQEFKNSEVASRITKISPRHIRECCLRERITAGGFIWREKGDELIENEYFYLLFNKLGKPVAQIDHNNNIIDVYKTVQEVANKYEIGVYNIRACCRGKTQTTNKGKFKYIENLNDDVKKIAIDMFKIKYMAVYAH